MHGWAQQSEVAVRHSVIHGVQHRQPRRAPRAFCVNVCFARTLSLNGRGGKARGIFSCNPSNEAVRLRRVFVQMMSPFRLRLVDGTLALSSAALEGRSALERLLGVTVAEGWEGFPEALPIVRASYEGRPEAHAWGSLFFIELSTQTLVGFGGFKGPPSPDGVVEIGYAIAPAFRGQGLATDAVAQMLARAFADITVRAVDAHTLGHDNPSTRVLQKAGFRRLAQLEDPDEGAVWQWRLERPGH